MLFMMSTHVMSAVHRPVIPKVYLRTLSTPYFRHYGESRGVPTGAIYAIAEDHADILWFGTSKGLLRYNGFSFKLFQHKFGDSDSLPIRQVYALYIDQDNRVWGGGMSDGLMVYNPNTHRFHSWKHVAADATSLANNEIWSIAQTPDGMMWIATQRGLDRLRRDGSGFDHVHLPEITMLKPKRPVVRALLATADGRLWIGASSGLFVREPDGKIHAVPIALGLYAHVHGIWRIQGRVGDVRVAMSGCLLRIGSDGVARPVDQSQVLTRHVAITSSVRDGRGQLWMTTRESGLLHDDGKGHLKQIPGHLLLPGGLSSNSIWQVIRDHEGGLWFAMAYSGIAYLPPGQSGFTRFTHIPDDSSSIAGTAVIALHATADGHLLLGGYGGWVDKIDPKTGVLEHLGHFRHGNIVAITSDIKGRLWLIEGSSVFRLDHGKLTKITTKRASINRPIFLVTGAKGTIYVASQNDGMFFINPDTMAIHALPLPSGIANVATINQIAVHAGHLWVASKGGLQILDEHLGRMVMVRGVPHVPVRAIGFGKHGFWIVSRQSLSHYRYAGREAIRDQHLDLSHQAFFPNLRSIHVDLQGNLWFFSSPGLWCMKVHNHKFVHYGEAQGLFNTDFTKGSVTLFPDGTFFAASSGGVLTFQPQKLVSSRLAVQPLRISWISVQRHGHTHFLPAQPGQVVKLGWQDRLLRVQVRLASYVDPDVSDYQFRLSQVDSDWVDAGNRGMREFTGLASGSYTLDVMAIDANGGRAYLKPHLLIQVQSPPWIRWWAWLAYLLVASFLAWLGWLFWQRRTVHQRQILLAEQKRHLAEQTSTAKSQFLAMISHEIRTPMTGVMGMAELLLATSQSPRQRKYTEAIRRSGELLLKLMNDTLDLASIELGRLELDPLPFDPRLLAEDMMALAQMQAKAKGLDLVLHLDRGLPRQLLGDALRIKQVLFNLLSNALKFTETGRVTLGMHWRGGALVCIVSDTGPGISKQDQSRLFERFEQSDGPQRHSGTGLGLAICRELVALMHGSIRLRSTPGRGSTFKVRMPLTVASEMPRSSAPLILETATHALDVLLVEDEDIVTQVMGGLLEKQGHRVRYAGDGLQALAELARKRCDVVFLDLGLPGLDGFQVARLIRRSQQSAVWIVAITARSGGDEEALSRAAGMNDFLRKPCTGAELAQVLARVSESASPPA